MGKRRGEEEKERREGEARSLPYQSKNRSCAPGLSVCLYVTLVNCVQMDERMIMYPMPHCSPVILVSSYQTLTKQL